VIWVVTFTSIGYFLAALFPEVVDFVHYIILAGIVLILLNTLKQIRKHTSRNGRKP